jgi:hypothetical protein
MEFAEGFEDQRRASPAGSAKQATRSATMIFGSPQPRRNISNPS